MRTKIDAGRRRRTSSGKNRRLAAELLHRIATSSSALHGERFFQALTQHLATALEMDYALVGELSHEPEPNVRLLGSWAGGQTGETFTYALAGTPCEQVLNRHPCVFPRNAQALFPGDQTLVELGVECYAGVPLFASSGAQLGLIAVMGRTPLRNPETVEQLLAAISARTATEIERQRLQHDLDESHRTMSTLMSNLPGMVYRCAHDENWTMLFASDGCLSLTGHAAEEFVRGSISYQQLIHPDDVEALSRELDEAIAGKHAFEVVYRIVTASGVIKWVWEQGRGVYAADGSLRALEGFITDISERVEARQQLQFQALHDALTSLPNRTMFLERLQHALKRSRWTRQPMAVIFLDLDRFKNINDTLGHDIGDVALQTAARRLTACVRERDTVARLGGDEFTLLLEDLASTDDVLVIARKILSELSKPFDCEGRELMVTASIGISLYPGDGEEPLTLLRNADTAMYRAKDLGRNKYQFYSSEMGARALMRFTLETSLRHALQRNELLLHYQPQVRLDTGELTGVEALLRWQHPDQGLLGPAEFLPVAEETGLMRLIDEWVLDQACAQARLWCDAGIRPIRMAVNVSGRTFNESRLLESVSSALENSGIAPDQLELEITESVVMDNAPATVATLGQLKNMGVRLAVDDFGTGYSSLGYLKRFPIDTLKIDQSFVRDVATCSEDASLVEAIVAMGHALRLNVIAEGVENEEQLTRLREQGCDSIQGYFVSHPLPADEMTRLLRSR